MLLNFRSNYIPVSEFQETNVFHTCLIEALDAQHWSFKVSYASLTLSHFSFYSVQYLILSLVISFLTHGPRKCFLVFCTGGISTHHPYRLLGPLCGA